MSSETTDKLEAADTSYVTIKTVSLTPEPKALTEPALTDKNASGDAEQLSSVVNDQMHLIRLDDNDDELADKLDTLEAGASNNNSNNSEIVTVPPNKTAPQSSADTALNTPPMVPLTKPSRSATDAKEEDVEDANYRSKYYTDENSLAMTSMATMRRAQTKTMEDKIPCWLTMDIHLLDILLAQETFEINAWLFVFFYDKDKTFVSQLSEKAKQTIATKRYIPYDDLNVKIRKKLPLKSSFLLNASNFDFRRAYLECSDMTKNVWKLYFRFSAHCAEHMELAHFPFDQQFLNLQLVYRVQDFYFLSECPEWIKVEDEYQTFKMDVPIKLTVKDSIKSQWVVEEPWIDLRKQREGYKFHFSLIRLRVRRQPAFYLVNAVLPLFLVVLCSFASLVMPTDEFVNDKLAYIVTLLLTVTAFQYSISADLPKTSETTLMDKYILLAYGILTFFVLEIAVVFEIDKRNPDLARVIDYSIGGIMAVLWLGIGARFVWGYWVMNHYDIDWDAVSHEEMHGWSKDMKGDTKYIGCATGKLLGTYDK